MTDGAPTDGPSSEADAAEDSSTDLFTYALPVAAALTTTAVVVLDGRRALAAGIAVGGGLVLVAAGLSARENGRT